MSAGWTILIIIVVIFILILLIKLFLIFSLGRDRSPTCLNGKTVVVTGANTGIGFYTAQDFAKRGARVILACRDPIKAKEAKSKIIQSTGNPNIVVRIVDLTSLASVRKFAVETKATEERLDILVNNAGLGGVKHSLTSDGLCLLMQINYFGPFLLTILLLDLIKKSAPSRIVNVSSGLAFLANLNIDDLNTYPRSLISPMMLMYSNSKLCNLLFTNELARRLEGTGVETNSLHPGVVKTEIFRYLSGFNKAMTILIGPIYKTPEEGAQTSIYLAVSQEIKGVTGEFFMDCKRTIMPKSGRDLELAKKLWEKTETIVKLTPVEKGCI